MTETNATNGTVLSDVDTVRKVVASRLHVYTSNNGYFESLPKFLQSAGIAHLVDLGGSSWTVDATPLMEAYAALLNDGKLTVTSTSRSPRMNTIRDHAHNILRQEIDKWYSGTNPERVEENGDVVDPLTVCAEFGETGPLHVEGDEAVAEMKRIIGEMLTVGERDGHCRTLEEIMIRIGMGRFMPPREVKRLVTVPGIGDLTVTIPCNRKGEPDTSQMAHLIQTAATQHWAEVAKTLELRELPEETPDDAATANA